MSRGSLGWYLTGALLLLGLTVAEAGPQLGFFDLDLQQRGALVTGRAVIAFLLFLRVARDLGLDRRIVLGSLVLGLVAGLLLLLGRPTPWSQELVLLPGTASGQALYDSHCGSCHGAFGVGVAGLGPGLADAVWLNGSSPEAIRGVIAEGVPGTSMGGWEKVLGDEGVDAVTGYVLSLGGAGVSAPEAPPAAP